MASRASTIFGANNKPAPVSKTANTVTHGGMPAWTMESADEYVQLLVANTLGNTFYTSKEKDLEKATELHQKMIAADPEFAAKAMVYARNQGYMRTQPVYALANLYSASAKANKGAQSRETELNKQNATNKMLDEKYARLSQDAWTLSALFEETFSLVVLTPDDLQDFYTMIGALGHGKGGRKLHRIVGEWMNSKVGTYWAVKYGAEGGSNTSLRYRARGAHWTAKTNTVKYVKSTDEKRAELNLAELSLEQIEWFNKLKTATTEDQKAQAITQGRLPHEVATTFIGDSKTLWNLLVPNMPIFALLRNLAKLERVGVLDSNKKYITGVFTSVEQISKSKILPYRFLKAMDYVSAGWAKDALRDATELALANMPAVVGTSAVMVDRSGSMQGEKMLTASIFGIAIMKQAEDGTMYLFDNNLEVFPVSKRDSLLSQAKTITARGGTLTNLPVEDLISKKTRVDNIVLITDGQQTAGTPFADTIQTYRKQVNKDVKVIVIDISAYGTAITPEDKNTVYIYGWSDRSLAYVGLVSRGFNSLAQTIKANTLAENAKRRLGLDAEAAMEAE